jgi:hypothetical protein
VEPGDQSLKKKCGPGQPPRPHLLCVNLPAAFAALSCQPDRVVLQRPIHAGCQLRWRIRTRKCGCILSRWLVAVPPCETVSEEAATPGCPRRFHALGTARQFTLGKTAAEPTLRDHWQRDSHACSESTLSHLRSCSNKKSPVGCANPVEDETSLWKIAEKVEEIGAGD